MEKKALVKLYMRSTKSRLLLDKGKIILFNYNKQPLLVDLKGNPNLSDTVWKEKLKMKQVLNSFH